MGVERRGNLKNAGWREENGVGEGGLVGEGGDFWAEISGFLA